MLTLHEVNKGHIETAFKKYSLGSINSRDKLIQMKRESLQVVKKETLRNSIAELVEASRRHFQ